MLSPKAAGSGSGMSRNSKIGYVILALGLIAVWKSMEGERIVWWFTVIGFALIYIGMWGAFGDFSKSYWRHNLLRRMPKPK